MFHVEHPEPRKKQQQKTRREAKEFEKIERRKKNLRMRGRFRVKL